VSGLASPDPFRRTSDIVPIAASGDV